MNEVLKAKYYKLINNKELEQYELVGTVLASIEDRLIMSSNQVDIEELINLIQPLKISEPNVYFEIEKDINTMLPFGGDINE